MTEFEFIFALYALLLGLSLVELLAGFGRAMEYKFARQAAHKTFKIGILTPLLAVFVILDLLSFWSFAWVTRELISVNSTTLMGVMLFAGSYYLAARLVFPTEPDDFTDLDEHFYRIRRIVIGILLTLVLVQWGFVLLQAPLVPTFTTVALTLLLIALMALAMIWKKDRLNAILLGVLIARYVIIYLL